MGVCRPERIQWSSNLFRLSAASLQPQEARPLCVSSFLTTVLVSEVLASSEQGVLRRWLLRCPWPVDTFTRIAKREHLHHLLQQHSVCTLSSFRLRPYCSCHFRRCRYLNAGAIHREEEGRAPRVIFGATRNSSSYLFVFRHFCVFEPSSWIFCDARDDLPHGVNRFLRTAS